MVNSTAISDALHSYRFCTMGAAVEGSICLYTMPNNLAAAVLSGRTHVFDSFECAIAALAPTCKHCSCKIIGHGVEANVAFYCSAHCAKAVGVQRVRDRS